MLRLLLMMLQLSCLGATSCSKLWHPEIQLYPNNIASNQRDRAREKHLTPLGLSMQLNSDSRVGCKQRGVGVSILELDASKWSYMYVEQVSRLARLLGCSVAREWSLDAGLF